MSRLRHTITYANVVSTLALVLAMSGGAVYAAGKIGGNDIRKGAVRSKQIRNRNVKRQDIAGGAINSRKVSNNTLTGKDIEESKLGLVPSADDARTVNGVAERVVRASEAQTTAASQLLSEGGLTVLLSCAGGNATMQVHGFAPGDAGTVFNAQTSSTQQFDSGTTQSVATSSAAPGFATVRRLDGTVTRFDYELIRDDNGFNSTDDCFLHGFLRTGK